MAGRVSFLIGRAGSGKTAVVRAGIKQARDRGQRAVCIVPEQFTFETERSLSASLGGLMGIEVLSLDRLADRVLRLCGEEAPYLSPQGERMVIRRAALSRNKELTALREASAQGGFAETMAELFSNLRGAQAEPQALKRAAEKLPPKSLLYGKLMDISLLYGDVTEYLSGRYLTLEDAANAAAMRISSSFIAGAPVYIDGLPGLTRQNLTLIKAVFAAAGETTVTLRMDPGAADREVFRPEEEALEQLTELARGCGCPVFTRTLEGRRSCDPALRHLERNLFSHPGEIYPEKTRAIGLWGCPDAAAEAELAADQALRSAREGLSWRDMAILVSDMDRYAFPVERALRKRGVPVFVDAKREIWNAGLTQCMFSAVECASRGFAPEDAVSMLKTGFCGVDSEDVFQLENYLLRYGLGGKSMTAPFLRGEVPAGAERARAAAMELLLPLGEGLKGKTVSLQTRAVYAFLTACGAREQLEADARRRLEEGQTSQYRLIAQLWNLLMELLSQLDAVLGDQTMSREAYLSLLEEGAKACRGGVMPESEDAVLLGEIHRTRSDSIRRLFILGANEGVFPQSRTDDGLISDGELRRVEEAGLPLWRDTAHYAALDRLDLYGAVSRAGERLTLSFSYASGTQELRPSPVVNRIARLFPLCRVESTLNAGDELPLSRQTGLGRMAGELRSWRDDGASSPLLGTLMEYYQADPGTRELAGRMLRSANMEFYPHPLSPALADALYAKSLATTASRLELFNACPFKHFMRYSLEARERKERVERSTELGSFYHEALNAFTRECLARGARFKEMTDQDADSIMDSVLPQVTAEHNDGVFLDSPRLRAGLFLLVNVAKQSARAVVRQLAAGSFTPLGAELRFGPGEALPPIRIPTGEKGELLLGGVIDRADRAGTPAGDAVRVVDYKTAGRKFDFASVSQGLTLQLPLYLAVAGESLAGEGGFGAGLYYMPVKIPVPQEGEGMEEELEKAFRLSGPTLSRREVIEATEEAMAGASGVVAGLRKNADGTVKGLLCDGREMDVLLTRAKEISARTGNRMRGGEISVSPFQGACRYCPFQPACRFDPTLPVCRTRKPKAVDEDVFFGRGGEEKAGAPSRGKKERSPVEPGKGGAEE